MASIGVTVQSRRGAASAAAVFQAARYLVLHLLLARRRLKLAGFPIVQTSIELVAATLIFGDPLLDECLASSQQSVIEIRVLSEESLLHRWRYLLRTFGVRFLLVRELETSAHQRFLRRGEFKRRLATAQSDCQDDCDRPGVWASRQHAKTIRRLPRAQQRLA